MQRVGDDTSGFSVDHPGPDATLVRAWGFWTVEVATAFTQVVIEACRGRAHGGNLTLDMSDIKPMREEAQQSFARVVHALPGAGVHRVSILTRNPLTKLQLARLVTESRTKATVEWLGGDVQLGRIA